MPPISKYARSTRGGFVKFYRAIRERWCVLMVTILGISVPVYAIAWFFDGFYNLAAKIAITSLVIAMPVIRFFSQPEPLTVRSWEFWLSIVSMLALVLFVGDRFDLQLISLNAFFVGVTLPSILVVGIVARREKIILAGFVPFLIAMMVYWSAGLAVNNVSFDLLFLPLPVVFFAGAIWAPLALLIMKFAQQHKNGRISGPGTQVLAMTMLFYPVTVVAITLPPGLGLSAMWSNVSLVLIGIFLSGVISEPLRRFLIEWGNLSPNQKASASYASTDHLSSRDPQEDD